MKNFGYFAPDTLQEALSLLDNKQQKAKVLAGGTDLIGQMRTGSLQPGFIIDIKKITELNCMELRGDKKLHIGAAVPIQ